MRSVREIEKEQLELKEQLETVQGTPTEVYTRIVGYYRSVNNWNRGKREEYNHRLLFNQPNNISAVIASELLDSGNTDETMEVPTEPLVPTAYLLFYRNACPNCPPVKAFLENLELNHENINVDTDEGIERATKFQVFAAPTVIFFDENDKEIARVHNVSGLKDLELPIGVMQ